MKLACVAWQHVAHDAAQQQAECHGGDQEGDLAVQVPVALMRAEILLASGAFQFDHCAAIIR